MAYGEIRFGEFKNTNGLEYKISILKKDYAGLSTSFKLGGQGFELKYNGEGDDMDSPIKSSECTFVFNSESTTDDAFIIDMIGADESDYLVEILYKPYGSFVDYWRGILIVDNAELSNLYYPQPFKMRAIDGLSLLKGKKVTELEDIWNIDGGVVGGVIEDFQIDSVGGPTWGGSVYQHRSLVIACLRLIPTSELFGTSYGDTFLYNNSCWENVQNTLSSSSFKKSDVLYGVAVRSDSFYTQSNDGQYKYMNCYDLLKSILLFYNIRLFYNTGGYWHTIQVGTYKEMLDNDVPYVRWRKDHNGSNYDGSGTSANLFIGELNESGDEGNRYKVGESSFAYEKQIKEIELNFKGDESDIYNIYHNYQDNPDLNITLDPNPDATDYINTFVLCSAGTNQTFTLRQKMLCETTSISSAYDPNIYYFLYYFTYIKVGDYYLYWNQASGKYKWSTTEQVVEPLNYNTWWWMSIVEGNTTPQNFLLGGVNTDQMDPIPVDGQLEFYTYKKIYEYDGGDIVPNSDLNTSVTNYFDPQTLTYGASSRSIEFDLYADGEQIIDADYLIQNKPLGNLVNGGLEIKRELLFTGQPSLSSGKAIYNYNGTSLTGVFFNHWKLDKQNNWKNTNIDGQINTSLPNLKGIEMIAIQPSNRKLLRATIITKSDVSNSNRPFRFSEIFEYDNKYWIANGFTLYANDGIIVGEFMELEYNINNAIALNPFNNSGGGDVGYGGGYDTGESVSDFF